MYNQHSCLFFEFSLSFLTFSPVPSKTIHTLVQPNIASAVSYLPMPVIGGYLAFIGYFCFEAGVGLAISQNIMSITDWMILYTKPSTLVLALPTLIAGVILTYITRNVKNDVALPCAMIVIPGLFYVVIFVSGIGMDGARTGGWMGGTLISNKYSSSSHRFSYQLLLITFFISTYP
jgi:hypothetical protein